MGGGNSKGALANVTAKIVGSRGKIAGSFAITTSGLSDEEVRAKAKETAKKY